MPKYSELLKDPRWQKKRLDILQRDNFECQSCMDSESTLHVHHVNYTYGENPWDYSDVLLITLCERCHGYETEKLKISKRSMIDSFSHLCPLADDYEKMSAAFLRISESVGGIRNFILLEAIIHCIEQIGSDRNKMDNIIEEYHDYWNKKARDREILKK